MSSVAFEQWHVAGLQAYKSTSDQGIDGAKRAQQSFTNPELKQLAVTVQQMADGQQELFEEYTRLSTSVVYPEAVKS